MELGCVSLQLSARAGQATDDDDAAVTRPTTCPEQDPDEIRKTCPQSQLSPSLDSERTVSPLDMITDHYIYATTASLAQKWLCELMEQRGRSRRLICLRCPCINALVPDRRSLGALK